MFRKSIFLVVCLAAVMLFISAVESNASPARVAGMNLGGHSAGFIRDYVNTYNYPVAIVRYPNMLWGHMGDAHGPHMDAEHRIMGMFKEVGEDGYYGVFGVTLREDSPTDPVLQEMGLDGATHQQFDLMWGRDFEQASLGLRFDMARSSFEDSDGNVQTPWSNYLGLDGYVNTYGFGAGVDVDLTEDAMLEVGGEFRMYTFKDETSSTTFEDDGSVSVRASARVFYERTENKTMVPMVTLMRTQVGEEDGLQDTWTDLFGGVACNHVVNGDDLLVYGAAMRWQSRKTENGAVERDFSTRSLPVLFVAAEHRFKDWLVGRGGASQAMVNRDYGSDHPGTYSDGKTMWGEFDFALGIGLEFSNFTIDGTLNQNFPFNGPYFISGDDTTDDMFGIVSFTYTFD
jgi:hypothetical protein